MISKEYLRPGVNTDGRTTSQRESRLVENSELSVMSKLLEFQRTEYEGALLMTCAASSSLSDVSTTCGPAGLMIVTRGGPAVGLELGTGVGEAVGATEGRGVEFISNVPEKASKLPPEHATRIA